MASSTAFVAVRNSAAEVKNTPQDLINVALEMLVKASLELPGFSTLNEAMSRIRGSAFGALDHDPKRTHRLPPFVGDAQHDLDCRHLLRGEFAVHVHDQVE